MWNKLKKYFTKVKIYLLPNIVRKEVYFPSLDFRLRDIHICHECESLIAKTHEIPLQFIDGIVINGKTIWESESVDWDKNTKFEGLLLKYYSSKNKEIEDEINVAI